MAAASVAAVLALPVGPASALADYTVTAGGSTTAVTATNVGQLVFEDTYLGPFGDPSNPKMTCTSLDSSGTVNPGDHVFTAAPPVTDAAVELNPGSAALSACTHSVTDGVTATSSGIWRLGLSDTSGTGYLSGVGVHFYVTAGGIYCEFDVAGALKGTYNDATGDFVLDPGFEGLVITGIEQTVRWCDTLGFYDDDPAVFGGTINLSPAPVIS